MFKLGKKRPNRNVGHPFGRATFPAWKTIHGTAEREVTSEYSTLAIKIEYIATVAHTSVMLVLYCDLLTYKHDQPHRLRWSRHWHPVKLEKRNIQG